MCGINGLMTRSSPASFNITEALASMNQSIFHRGPDQDGFFEKVEDGYSVGMGMRRLSIIDLSTGRQPIYSDDGSIVIVFNGEIYNYKELKKELEEEGIIFKTTSDTEVILRLYEKIGTKAFGILDGMFAFSIYDHNLKKIFIARDFFGEKPLYYTQNNRGLFWGSELKSLLSVIDRKPPISKVGLNLYFQLTYIPAPFTIYEGIKKLEANHFLEANCTDFSISINEIEQPIPDKVDPQISFKEAKDKTKSLVRGSVLSRSVADVPIGTFLSGGVDSSVVSLCLAQQSNNQIDTFSIGFEKKSFDESDKARTVASLINSNHHEFIISEDDLKDNVDQILLNFDEPFADSSSLPTFLVASKTRQHVKVALTGDGGDEVFGGYNKYYMGKLNSRYTKLVPQQFHGAIKSVLSPALSTSDDKRGRRFQFKKLLNSINYNSEFYYKIISLGYQEEELNYLLLKDQFTPHALHFYKQKIGEKNKTLHDFRNIDQLLSLEGDMLVKVDRTSMLTSLESRSPFLNKRLWNFTSQLPENFLMKGWNKKYILKESFQEYFPENFLNKSKKGFGVPVGDWLRGYLSQELESLCTTEFLEVQQIFDPPVIQELVKNHLSGKEDNTFRVWTFFCFQKWYRESYSRV